MPSIDAKGREASIAPAALLVPVCLLLTNRADSEVAGLESNFAMENGHKFESEERTVLIQELHSEEHTVRIQGQRI